MATLTSASSIDDIIAAHADNASYLEDSSPAKCRAFITACRIFKAKLLTSGGVGAARTEHKPEALDKEIAQALDWLAANNTASNGTASGGGVLHLSLEGFRR